MQIGVVFPTQEIGDDPVAIRDFAQAAEEIGYRHLLAYDHVLGAEHRDRDPMLQGPYTQEHQFHEPFVLFGYLAGLTTTLELVVGVLVLPQRQTALVAKQAAEVDLLSNERLRLGVGTGWNWVEYDALNEDFDSRGRRLTEQVELLRRLWAEPVVDFESDHHRVARAGLAPMPRRRIPVWFGGGSDISLRRAARLGDGFVFGHAGMRARRSIERLEVLLDEQGRAGDEFGFEAMVDFVAGPEKLAEEADAWSAAGGTHLSIRVMDASAEFMGIGTYGYTGLDSRIAALQTFWDITH